MFMEALSAFASLQSDQGAIRKVHSLLCDTERDMEEELCLPLVFWGLMVDRDQFLLRTQRQLWLRPGVHGIETGTV